MSVIGNLLIKLDESQSKLSYKNDTRIINLFKKYENSFLVLNKVSGKLEIVELKKNKNTNLYEFDKNLFTIIFKLIPISVEEKSLDRVRRKGLRDVSPTFEDLNERINRKNNGEISNFKAFIKTPSILLGEFEEKIHLHIFKVSNTKLFDIKPLPRVSAIGKPGKQILLFSIFDFMPNRYSRTEYRKIIKAITGKSKDNDDSYFISKKDLNTIWKIGCTLIISSLTCNNETVNNLVLPESSGDILQIVKETVSNIFPECKIIVIGKEDINSIYNYYINNKGKYKELEEKVVNEVKENSDYVNYLIKEDKYKDLFKNVDGEFYDILKNGKLSMSEIPGLLRPVYSKIHSDYIISLNRYKDMKGKSIIIDDVVTTGSTIRDFILPIINSSDCESVISFCFLGNKGYNTSIFGVDNLRRK